MASQYLGQILTHIPLIVISHIRLTKKNIFSNIAVMINLLKNHSTFIFS